MSGTNACPSEYQLDAYWLAGRPSEHPLVAHLDHCEGCQERLRAYQETAQTFDREVFPATVETVTEQLTSHWVTRFLERWAAPRPLLWAPAAMAVLLVALFITPPDPHLATKGPMTLQVWCKRGDRVFQVEERERLFANDAVRFVPVLSNKEEPGFLMVVSVDHRGIVSRFFPPDQHQAQRASLGPEGGLPGSIILSAGNGPERVYLLRSDRMFDFEEVKKAATLGFAEKESVESLERLPIDLSQASLLFHLESPE